jgi:hypothetical protein
MEIITLIIGIVIGAAFSPFWIKLYQIGWNKISALIERLKSKSEK